MPANQPYEEKELLLRTAAGDEQAFHSLYNRYFPKVYAMALHYLPDAFMAQDMVQDVFAQVWKSRLDIKQVQHFEAWLITVTKNHLIKALRKMYPAGKIYPAGRFLSGTDEPPTGGEPHTGSDTTYAYLDYRELEKRLKEAVAALSPRQREVYHLSRQKGYSHKEIAGQLGISVDVSREHLSKALGAIRALLREKYGLGAWIWFLWYIFF